MEAKFSARVKDVISYSREESLRLGHDYIGVEHLLLGLIREGEGIAIKIIKQANVDLKELRKSLEVNSLQTLENLLIAVIYL
jgi:ATP-dependent Clp protease ATP-binding subunit ClpC